MIPEVRLPNVHLNSESVWDTIDLLGCTVTNVSALSRSDDDAHPGKHVQGREASASER